MTFPSQDPLTTQSPQPARSIDDTLRLVGFRYIPEFQVLACISCKKCYTRGYAIRHAIKSHHIDLGSERANVHGVVKHLPIAEQVTVPADFGLPLDFLNIDKTWYCKTHRYLAPGLDWKNLMAAHVSNDHAEVKEAWSPESENTPEILRVHTQQFYSPRSRKKSISSSGTEDKSPFIFVVSAPESPAEPPPQDVIFQQLQVEHNLLPAAVRPTAHAVNDQLPWLQITNIQQHLPVDDLLAYAQLTNCADKKDRKTKLFRGILNRLYNACLVLITGQVTSRLSQIVRTQIETEQNNGVSGRSFVAISKKSQGNYRNLWIRFIFYLLQAHMDPVMAKRFSIPLPPPMPKCLSEIDQLLNDISVRIDTASQVEEAVSSRISQSVCDLMQAVIEQSVLFNTFRSPLACFLACLSVDPVKGTIKPAHLCTPSWACLKYALRLFFYSNALKQYILPVASLPVDDPALESAEKEVLSKFNQSHATYLSAGKNATGVFAWIAMCIGFGKHLGHNGNKQLNITCLKPGDASVLLFNGERVALEDWSDMIRSEIAIMMRHMDENLLFGCLAELPMPTEFIDTLEEMPELNSFVDVPANNSVKNPLKTIYMRLISRWSELRSQSSHLQTLLQPPSEKNLPFRFSISGRKTYADQRRKFLHMLAMLLHLTSGMPGRGPEMLSIRFKNTDCSQRNVFILQGLVTIITNYWKGMSLNGKERVIPRVPVPSVGRALFLYIVYIEPIERFMSARPEGPSFFVDSCYVFPDESDPSNFFPTDILTDLIKKATLQYLGVCLTTRDNRHLQKTWGRELLDESSIQLLREADPEMIEEERPNLPNKEDSEDTGGQARDLQMGHGIKTATTYGMQKSSTDHLTLQSLTTYQTLSLNVHRLFKLADVNAPQERPPGDLSPRAQLETSEIQVENTPADESDTVTTVVDDFHLPPSSLVPNTITGEELDIITIESSPLESSLTNATISTQVSPSKRAEPKDHALASPTKRTKPLLPRLNTDMDMPDVSALPTLEITATANAVVSTFTITPSMTARIKRITGGSGQFKNIPQRDCLQYISNAVPHSTTLVVLPTGSGKTLLYLYKYDTRATVVVFPLKSVLEQVMALCVRAQIDCIHWTPQSEDHTFGSVIVVSVEHSLLPRFLSYCTRWVSRDLISRLFIDECHLILRATDNFRPELLNVHHLRRIDVPTFYLTATMELSQISTFKERYLIEELQILRYPTNRANIHIQLELRESSNQVEGLLRTRLKRYAEVVQGRGRILVFLNNTSRLEKLAAEMNYHQYHSKSDIKHDELKDWLSERPRSKIMIATSSLECGIDYPSVRVVIHVGTIDDISQLAQEMGRAGRDQERSDFLILGEKSCDYGLPPATLLDCCIRDRFSRELDGLAHACTLEDAACTYCAAAFNLSSSFTSSSETSSRRSVAVSNPDSFTTPLRQTMPALQRTGSDFRKLLKFPRNNEPEASPIQCTLDPRQSAPIIHRYQGDLPRTGPLLLADKQRDLARKKHKLFNFINSLRGLCSPCVAIFGLEVGANHHFGSGERCSSYEREDYEKNFLTALNLGTGNICFGCHMPQFTELCCTPCRGRGPYVHILDSLLYVVFQERESPEIQPVLDQLQVATNSIVDFVHWCELGSTWHGKKANKAWQLFVAILVQFELVDEI